MLRALFRGTLQKVFLSNTETLGRGFSPSILPSTLMRPLTYPSYWFSTDQKKDVYSSSIPLEENSEVRKNNVNSVKTQTSASNQDSNLQNESELIFPIGITDFTEIIQYSGYVDKTLLLYYILFDGKKVISFNLPRRWGKTTTLSMIEWCLAWDLYLKKKHLQEINKCSLLNSEIKVLRSQAQNLKSVIQNMKKNVSTSSSLLTDFQNQLIILDSKIETLRKSISAQIQNMKNTQKSLQDKTFFKEMLSKKQIFKKVPNLQTNPIINLGPPSKVICQKIQEDPQREYRQAIRNFKSSISQCFLQHSYLTSWMEKQCQPQEFNFFKSICSYLTKIEISSEEQKQKIDKEIFSDEAIAKSIPFLSKFLIKYWGQKPIILIDEYDQAYLDNIDKPFKKIFFSMLSSFYKSFFKGDGSKYNFKVVIMGIAPITYVDEFSNLNNVTDYNMGSSEANILFGFVESEVKQKLWKVFDMIEKKLKKKDPQKYKFSEAERQEQFKEIKEWANGYWAYGQELYNPWTINHCLQAVFKATSWPVRQFEPKWYLAGHLSLIRKIINETTEDQEEEIRKFILNQCEVYIEDMAKITQRRHLDELLFTTNVFYFLLFHCGYLTKDKSRSGYLIPPNKEIIQYFFPEIFNILLEKHFPGIQKQISSDKEKKLEKIINSLMSNVQQEEKWANALKRLTEYFLNLIQLPTRKAFFQNKEVIRSQMKIKQSLIKNYLKVFYSKRVDQSGFEIEFEKIGSGNKKMDRFISSKKKDIVMIHEDKVCYSQGEAERKQFEALTQILDKYLEDALKEVQQMNKKEDQIKINKIRITTFVLIQTQSPHQHNSFQFSTHVRTKGFSFEMEKAKELLNKFKEIQQTWKKEKEKKKKNEFEEEEEEKEVGWKNKSKQLKKLLQSIEISAKSEEFEGELSQQQ